MKAAELLDMLKGLGAEVMLRDGHLVLRPAWVAASYRFLPERHCYRLMLMLASRQVWSDAEGDPILIWGRAVLRGDLVVAKREIAFVEPGTGPVVVEPLGYLARQMASLWRAQAMVAGDGLGKAWPPAWWQWRARETVSCIKALAAAWQAALEELEAMVAKEEVPRRRAARPANGARPSQATRGLE